MAADWNDRRPDSESEDFSSLFDRYSDGLNRSSEALLNAARSFDNSSGNIRNSTRDLDRGFGRNVDRLIRALGDFNRDFDRTAREEAESREDSANEEEVGRRNNVRDMSSQFERVFGRRSNSYVNIAIKSLSKVFTFAISQFTNAFNRVVDNYNTNFTAITSRMQLSAGEYTKMLQSSTNWIVKDKGLKNQFTQIDWAGQLIPVLETGIRSGFAKQMAYQNMVTNRLLPMINTNTKAYTRLSKTFGDSFSEATRAIGTYTERVYGAEGLEEGQLENLLQSTYREIMTAVRERGGTADDFNRVWQGTVGTFQEYSSRYGSEAASNMLSDFVDSLTNTVSNDNILALMAASKSGIVGGDLSRLDEKTLSKFFKAEAQAYKDMGGSQSGVAFTSQAGIGNIQTYHDINNYDYFGKSIPGFDINSFNSQEESDRNWKNLQKGYYVSITDQMDNWNINTVANAADKAAELIPHTNEVLSMIFDMIKAFFLAWLAGRGVDSLTGGKGLGSLFSRGRGSNVAGGGLAKILSAGKGASLFNGGATAGTYLAGAAGIGGLIWSGVDAYKGVSASIARGDSALGVAGQGARSFLTGRYAMSNEAQVDAMSQALLGEEKSLDWGSALKNAGKGALLGAGASSVIPGLGTVVGTVVGGLVGGVANLIDQAIENQKFNRLAKASKSLNSSLETLSKTSSNFNHVVEKEKGIQEALNILNDKYYDSQGNLVKATDDQKQAALDYIREQDPMLQGIKDLKDWDEKYTEIVERKVKQEKILSASDNLTAADEVLGTIGEYKNSFDNLINDKWVNPEILKWIAGAIDSSNMITNTDDHGTVRTMSKYDWLSRDSHYYDTQINALASRTGMSREKVEEQLHLAGFDYNKHKTYKDDSLVREIANDIMKNNEGMTYQEAIDLADSYGLLSYDTGSIGINNWGEYNPETGYAYGIENQEDYDRQVNASMQSRLGAIMSAYNSTKDTLDAFITEDGAGNKSISGLPASTKNLVESNLNKVLHEMSSYNDDVARYYPKDEQELQSFLYQNYDWAPFILAGLLSNDFSGKSGVIKGYRTGLSRVPINDYPALLHENEMVLTSAQADVLRSLASESGTNVGGLLSSHFSSKAKPVNVNFNMSSISAPIVEAIKSQTVAIVNVLSDIYDLLGSLRSVLSSSDSNEGYSPSILRYEGV